MIRWLRARWLRQAPPAAGQEMCCTVATGPGRGLLLHFQFANGDEIVSAMPRDTALEYLDAILEALGDE